MGRIFHSLPAGGRSALSICDVHWEVEWPCVKPEFNLGRIKWYNTRSLSWFVSCTRECFCCDKPRAALIWGRKQKGSGPETTGGSSGSITRRKFNQTLQTLAGAHTGACKDEAEVSLIARRSDRRVSRRVPSGAATVSPLPCALTSQCWEVLNEERQLLLICLLWNTAVASWVNGYGKCSTEVQGTVQVGGKSRCASEQCV